jgi:ketosteroid isomerase-like protein
VRCGNVVWGALLALILSGCASTTIQSYQPKTQDEALVLATLMKIPNGIKDRSLDLIMQPYAEDVYIGNFQKYLGVAAPDAPLKISKQELRQVYARLFKDVKTLSMTVTDFHVNVSGDRAVAQGRTTLSYKVEGGRGEKRDEVLPNDVLWRLQHTPNGWKIKEEIYQ